MMKKDQNETAQGAERVPQIKKYLMLRAARHNIPLSGTFELTPRCNMNCRMCYIRMTEEEMNMRGREYTAEEWIGMGKACAEQGMLFLLLTGGEPFLRKDFRQIYTELKKLGLLITINTNGTLIDRETVEWLRKDPPIMMNITLYGKNEAAYERLCGFRDGYRRTVQAVEMLTEAGIRVSISISMTKFNEADLEDIMEFAKERKLPMRITSYLFPPVRSAREGVTDEEVRFTSQECAKTRYRSVKGQVTAEEFAGMKEAYRKGILQVPPETEECDRTGGEKMGCMAGRGAFWITWDGRMTPCGMMNEPAARPFEDGFVPCWQQIVKETDRILLPPECGVCRARELCPVCGALALAEGNGDSTRRPLYLCEGIKHFIELMQGADETGAHSIRGSENDSREMEK